MKKKILLVLLTMSFLLSSYATFFVSEVFAKGLNDREYYDVWDTFCDDLNLDNDEIVEYENVDSYLKEHYENYENIDKSSITELGLYYVEQLRIKDYSDLSDFSNLEHLSIFSYDYQTPLKINTLNLSELENLISLGLYGVDYSNLGLDSLTNLEQLSIINYCEVEYDYTLDLSNLTNLRAFDYYLDCWWMYPGGLNSEEYAELKESILEDINSKFIVIEGYELSVYEYDLLSFEITLMEKLNIELITNKDKYNIGNEIELGLELDRAVQASDFEILFDASKLEFVGASIGEDFYNLYESGRLIVSWASFENVNLTEMNFAFKAVGSGDASFVILPENFATGDMDAEFLFNESKKVVNIEKSDYIKSDATIDTVIRENKELITGVELKDNKLTLENFLAEDNFETNYVVKVFDINNNEITNVNKSLGTGTKVRLYENDVMVKEYSIVIYGDTTGDGEIAASDALMLIKAINKKYTFTDEIFVEAGKIISNADGDPTAVDALAIIKHLNKKYTINQ